MIKEYAYNEILYFMNNLEETLTRSDLVFYKINQIIIQLSKSKKTKAGSYFKTPEVLQYKKAIVNIKNTDDKCLEWCLLAYKHYEDINNKDKNDPKHYKKYYNELNIPKDIKYPIDIQHDIKKYEKLNDIKINVFTYENNDKDFTNLQTLYNTTTRNEHVCNLLLIKNDTTEHLCWIKDLSKLKKMKYDEHKYYFCSQCLEAGYDSKEKLDNHLKLCMNHEAVNCVMPKTADELKSIELSKLEHKIDICNQKIEKQKANSICECGSNLKYKKCCFLKKPMNKETITNENFINTETKNIKEQINELQNQMKKLDDREFKDQTKIFFKILITNLNILFLSIWILNQH